MAGSRKLRIKGRWVQGTLLGVVSALALTILVPLWLDVTRKLDEMSTARRDNVIWTVLQLEVEYLELERAAIELQTRGPEAVPELRRRFNVFYSRVGTLRQSPLYRSAIAEAGESANLEAVFDGIERLLPLIDGEDTALVAQRDPLIQHLDRLHVPTRRVVANANFVLTSRTESAREEAALLVGRLGIASLVLFGGLMGLALLFSRLYVIYKVRARDNLQTSQRLATVVSTSPDAIIVTDAGGVIQDYNPAAETLLTYGRDEALGRNLSEFIADMAGRPIALPFKLQNFFRQRMVGMARTGREIPLEVSQGATSLESRRVYVYFLRDITDRLQSEEALRGSRDKALAGERAKAHFLAVMSHEMRTPLNGILGVVELLKDRPHSDKDRHYLSLLENAGQVLLGHVNEVLDITEIEARGIKLSIAPFHLDALLHEVIEAQRPAATANGNSLTLSLAPDPLGYFLGDAMRLRQVVANLVSNAIKFTHDGSIELSVSAQNTVGGVHLEFQVSDTGVGIDDAQQARVFDDFVRLDRGRGIQVEGTGLGLGIVRRMVSAMKGQIGVDSVAGEGSLFWVTLTLPRADTGTEAPPPAPEHEQKPPARRPLDILLVEDNPTNRFVMKEMLELDGHHICEAENGQIGADLAARCDFDVILMDINMPVMGGLEATRLIRAGGASRSSRIVALTAHVMDQDAQMYREAGIDRVLAKPISRRNLTRALHGEATPLERPEPGAVLDPEIQRQLWGNLGERKAATVNAEVLSQGGALMEWLKLPEVLDRQDLIARLHDFAGLCAIVGAMRMHQCLSQAQNVLSSDPTVQLDDVLAPIHAAWPETRSALETRKTA